MREWSLKGLLLADTTVSPENPGRCEFAKFMANHIFRDVNRHEGLAVVNCKVMADESGVIIDLRLQVLMGLRSDPASATASIFARSF